MKRKKKSDLQKKKDNPNSKYWRGKADGAWGRVIHKEQDSRCAVCGKPGQAHHLINRVVPFTRHTIKNGMILCTWHHQYCPDCSPHGGAIGFAVWLKEHDLELYEWALATKQEMKRPYNYKETYERLTKELEGG